VTILQPHDLARCGNAQTLIPHCMVNVHKAHMIGFKQSFKGNLVKDEPIDVPSFLDQNLNLEKSTILYYPKNDSK